ncbi:protein of unknown function DUF177 [Methylocella silvestris BL2]|uniref:DUF177 domain-containing protein n=1 Tax=Methylocella silvestris (strain DSM 15510 / CIP 108128 / LMG 27833 / NCIMB 13906 / BL2) TaxID=395965 RepID=B8ENB3_METSB|nr:DUF177 domain-containing protein [Methylocella silvestris]ACK49626.1 protein of unknown function DUF177 [Methylocella silvestris BL2]
MKSNDWRQTGKTRCAPAEKEGAPSVASLMPRIVKISEVPDTGLKIAAIADPAERAAIAAADGLVAIESLTADLEITKEGARIEVGGRLKARVVATCVVTLDPFETEVEGDIEADFVVAREPAPRGPRAARGARREPEPPPVILEGPEPILNGQIDLGALVEEFLVLNLDPHPRKPGASFDADAVLGAAEDAASPFAVLKKRTDE